MSEVDPSIALGVRPVQFENPMDLQAKALQIRQLGLQTQTQQRDFQNQQTLADLYRNNIGADGSVNHEAIRAGMAKSGLGAMIPGYDKSLLDVTKTQGEIGETAAKTGQANASTAKTQLETTLQHVQNVGAHIYSLAQDPNLTHDSAYAAINSWVNQGIVKPEEGAQIARTLPGDPQALKSYMLQKATEGLGIEQQIKAQLDTAPKYNEQDRGAVIDQGAVDPRTGIRTSSGTTIAKSMTPDQKAKVKLIQDRGTFTGDAGDLLASLAAKGVSLPAGMRSKEQQISTLNGLMRKYPNMSPDEIADNIATGQIGFGAAKKEITVAAAQAGRVSIAANELETFGSQVLDASKDLPRGSSMTINGLMQLGEKEISDPQLLRLRVKLQALNSAYDQLAARGGTDADKRAHIHELFNVRLSDAGIHTLVQALNEESDGAKAAAAKAQEYHPPANAPAGRTPDSSTPPDIAALLKKHGGK